MARRWQRVGGGSGGSGGSLAAAWRLRWQQHGGQSSSRGGGSLEVAAWRRPRQRSSSVAAVAVAARWQRGGSAAAAAWRWWRQLGDSGSAVAEAAVGDGQDEGGEVVTWGLFMFVIFLHLQVQSGSTVPRGLTYKCVCVKFTLKLARFKCICDGFGKI
jgi:hypothetical protein